jgi:predicted metal-dependent hydrolase
MEHHGQSLTVEMEGIGPVSYHLSARARRVRIVLRPFRGVRVSVPLHLPFSMAAEFVASKKRWLLESLQRLVRLEEELTSRQPPMPVIAPAESRKLLTCRLAELAARHGFQYNRVTIRCQKTRWGSCSRQNNISLNLMLVVLPAELRDLVLLHELIHTRIKNHGPEFWAELERLAGGAQEKTRRLRQYCLAAMCP